ncbi:MAG TPA: DUF1992 domain-containing protein [Beutenbergiaceae bacterium]|nr:DUF1992 domain-containing protein [Beutenbergiaceae bacterium]
MVERIPGGVPIHSWVDRLIREAEERGEFDNLPGTGKPLPGIDKPLEEDWWVKQKIRAEEVPPDVLLPPALQLRREIAGLPDAVRDLPDEESVRARVSEVNQRVAEWIRAPSGPVIPVAPAPVEEIVAGWRAARAQPPTPSAAPDPSVRDPGGSAAAEQQSASFSDQPATAVPDGVGMDGPVRRDRWWQFWRRGRRGAPRSP